MGRKAQTRNPAEPASSHPQAEAEVRIFTPACRRALRRGELKHAARKAIVSIDGRDVEEMQVEEDQAA